MAEQQEQSPPWADVLREVISGTERALAAMREIEQWVWDSVVGHDVLPRQLPRDLSCHLRTLAENLVVVSDAAGKAFSRLCSEPSAKWLMGRMLSEEEFRLLQAMGLFRDLAKAAGLATTTDYELFEHLYYDDDETRCYINVGLGIGRQPEELRLKHLRTEQKVFLEKHFPAVLARFRSD